MGIYGKNVKKYKKVAKNTTLESLESLESGLEEKHTAFMIAIQVYKDIVKELELDYTICRSDPPIITINSGYELEFMPTSNSVRMVCEGTNFIIPMNDEYIDRVKQILDVMKFADSNGDYCNADDIPF